MKSSISGNLSFFIGKATGRNTQMVSCQQGSLPVVYPPRLDFQCTGLCQSSGFIDAGSYGSCIGYMSVCRNGDVFPRGDGFVVFQAACAEVCISFAVDGAAVFQVAVPVKGEVVFGAPCAAVIDAQSFFCPH